MAEGKRGISRRRLCTSAIAAATLPLISGCSRRDGKRANGTATNAPATGSTFAFDTYCTFTVYGDASAPAKLSQACARFDRLFSLYDDTSDIARINAACGQAIEVAPETLGLLTHALEFCASAQGLFDITIGAVSTLWDFSKGVRPSDQQIADALPHVNWQFVEIDEEHGTVRLNDPQAKIDVGGIAKGYVADRLCDMLANETSASGAVISLGGNIAFFGEKPGGDPWEAGIRDPNEPGGSSVVGTVRVNGGSLVTSGLYERTFELDGTTYWHILDPRTGMPVETDVVSDTVFCPSSTEADTLSTTLLIAGSRAGATVADAYEGTGAYFILDTGATAASSRWQDLTDFRA